MDSRKIKPGPEETAAGPRGVRRYERPRILSRELLEAVAAVCVPPGRAKGSPGQCPRGPIQS